MGRKLICKRAQEATADSILFASCSPTASSLPLPGTWALHAHSRPYPHPAESDLHILCEAGANLPPTFPSPTGPSPSHVGLFGHGAESRAHAWVLWRTGVPKSLGLVAAVTCGGAGGGRGLKTAPSDSAQQHLHWFPCRRLWLAGSPSAFLRMSRLTRSAYQRVNGTSSSSSSSSSSYDIFMRNRLTYGT